MGKDVLAKSISSVLAALILMLLGWGYKVLTGIQVTQSATLISVTGVLLAAPLIGFFCYDRAKYIYARLPRSSFDFDILHKEITMSVLNAEGTKMRYTKRVRVRARRNGLQEYTDKYRWSGNRAPQIRSNIKNQEFAETTKHNLFQCYVVRFGKTLRRGEEIQTDLVWEIEDPDKSANTFICASIEEPTLLLTLCLETPEKMKLDAVTCDSSTSFTSLKPYESVILQVNKGTAKWPVPKPRLCHHYTLKWKW